MTAEINYEELLDSGQFTESWFNAVDGLAFTAGISKASARDILTHMETRTPVTMTTTVQVIQRARNTRTFTTDISVRRKMEGRDYYYTVRWIRREL